MRRKIIDMTPELSEEMLSMLTKFSTSRSLPSSLVLRSKLIVLASEGKNNKVISETIGLNPNRVGKWRNRFLDKLPTLREIEAKDPDRLLEELKILLSDQPRPGAPATFTAEQILKVINLACEPPTAHGYERSHWSFESLAEAVVKLKIANEISSTTVERFLKDSRFTPTQEPLLVKFSREERRS